MHIANSDAATGRFPDRAERLDLLDSPLPWLLSAVADCRLRRFDDAERSIREEMKLDPQLRNGRAQYIRGLILIAGRGVPAASSGPHDVDAAGTMLATMQPMGLQIGVFFRSFRLAPGFQYRNGQAPVSWINVQFRCRLVA